MVHCDWQTFRCKHLLAVGVVSNVSYFLVVIRRVHSVKESSRVVSVIVNSKWTEKNVKSRWNYWILPQNVRLAGKTEKKVGVYFVKEVRLADFCFLISIIFCIWSKHVNMDCIFNTRLHCIFSSEEERLHLEEKFALLMRSCREE